MMLIEMTTVASNVLPVAQFRDHLRMGSGFSDEGAEDVLLQAMLRAAITAVETRTGKALLARDFALSLRAWARPDAQVLPVGPVSSVARVVQVDAIDSETVVDPATWKLVPGTLTSELTGRGGCLPSIPMDGAIRIEFTAGFGADWSAIPADLALAVMMLAATYYEHRSEARGGADLMPHGVTALLEPHRLVRVGLGGGTA